MAKEKSNYKGDYILAVDGQPVQATADIYSLLVGKAGKKDGSEEEVR